MFNLRLVLVIAVAAIPGVLIVVPRLLEQLSGTMEARLPEGKTLPPRPVLIAAQVAQALVLAFAFSALGAFFAPRAGLEAPFFEALATGSPIGPTLPNPLPVLLVSLGGSAVFLALYYGVLRPWMDPQTADTMDGLRNRLGLGARILYGGVVEEILTRWGLMSLLAWLFGLILGPTLAIWLAIVVSGVIFGLGHIPSYAAVGCRPSLPLYVTQITLNLLASLIFGWLFWRHGLAAAMISHALFHLVWYPIDKVRDRSVVSRSDASRSV